MVDRMSFAAPNQIYASNHQRPLDCCCKQLENQSIIDDIMFNGPMAANDKRTCRRHTMIATLLLADREQSQCVTQLIADQ